MTRKALGRGLSALLGDEPQTPKAALPQNRAAQKATEDYFELDIELIRPNSEQPRTNFGESALEELAQSIRANGIVQPIVVRRNGKSYEIVAGERRWRAAQRAGLMKIPVIVKEVADDKLLELALIENIQRQELNPVEEARAYKNLIDGMGFTQEILASRVGKDRTFIANYLRMLKLPEDILELIAGDRLTVGHGRALLTLDSADKARRLARKVIEMGLSVRETEKAAKRLAHGGEEKAVVKAAKPKQDANVKAAETKLRRKYATHVSIERDGKKPGGVIRLEYYSESDLDRIFRIMMGGK
jgi:ParB family transcriptional regulator, chromosome partitioning protein